MLRNAGFAVASSLKKTFAVTADPVTAAITSNVNVMQKAAYHENVRILLKKKK